MVLPRDGAPGEDDADAAVERLRALLRFPTVSRTDPEETDPVPFDALLDALPRLYPRAHAVLHRELVAGRTALYRWPGREPGEPAVLMAHYDVVPAPAEGWAHPPFGGDLTGELTGPAGGPGDRRVVHGRGALDMKGVLASLLQAVERLAARGHRPRHDVLLHLGHDEEVAGGGAPAVVELLRGRGLRPRLVLDEGGAVVEGVLPGVRVPLAVVGVAEKGTATVVLRAREPGGHAAMPPRTTAATRLARAVVRLDRRPHPARLDGPVRRMLAAAAPHAGTPHRWLYARADLLARPLAAALARQGGTSAALVRTTQAVTQLRGSPAPNVLGEEALAVVNLRVAPGSSTAGAVAHLRRAVGDPRVEVELVHASEPSPLSPAHGEAWELLSTTIGEVFGEAVVVPYVMLQASDSRHYCSLTDRVYRFMPFDMSPEERATLHGVDERIRVPTFLRAVDFHAALLARL